LSEVRTKEPKPAIAGFFSSIRKQIMISPLIAAIAIAVLAALAFGGGFAVSHWRSSAEITRLTGDNTLLTASNVKCVTDIQSVRSAIKAMEDVAVERERQAEEAMRNVEPVVERRKATVTRIRQLAEVPEDKQCKAIEEEQIAYVQARRTESD
jgi:hypothetical protein